MEKNHLFLILIVFLLAVLTLFVAYSYETKFTGFAVVEQKEEFSQGENFLSLISGNFIDRITNENVFFYREHERIPLVYEILKINEDYYVSALLGDKQPGNYSLVVKNVRYRKGLQETDEDIVKNFTITESTADFYVNPGVLSVSENFSIEVQNLKDKKITIGIRTPREFYVSEDSFELSSGQAKEINFRINKNEIQASSFLEKIEFSSENTSYSLPVFVTGLEVAEKSSESEFRFEPKTINVSLATNSDVKRIIYLFNEKGNAEKINLSISPNLASYVNVSPLFIDILKNGSAEKIEILFKSGADEKNITGWITASKENFSTSMTIFLSFIKNFVPEIPETKEGIIISTCEQLNGTICAEDEKCNEKNIEAKDGLCCLSICEKIPKSSSGKYLGWGIIIVIILFLIWFFIKYKRTHQNVDLLDVGKGKRF